MTWRSFTTAVWGDMTRRLNQLQRALPPSEWLKSKTLQSISSKCALKALPDEYTQSRYVLFDRSGPECTVKFQTQGTPPQLTLTTSSSYMWHGSVILASRTDANRSDKNRTFVTYSPNTPQKKTDTVWMLMLVCTLRFGFSTSHVTTSAQIARLLTRTMTWQVQMW